MNKTVMTFFIGISLSIQSSDLISLDSYMAKNDLNDATVLEYVAKRCSAANLAMTRWSKEGDQVYDIGFENYLSWFMKANVLRSIKYPEQDPEIAGKNILDSILVMTDEIDKIMKYSQDIRGSVWEGNFMSDDLVICKTASE